MKDFIKNFQVNVEMAAAVYLSAQTEAIATHDQKVYILSEPACGTSACLAGHAILLEHGSVTRAMDVICTDAISGKSDAGSGTTYPREAMRVLLNGADSLPRMLIGWKTSAVKLCKNGDITEDEKDAFLLCIHELRQVFSLDSTSHNREAEALDDFYVWVKKWATGDAFARFKELIALDTAALYDEAGITVSV